MTFLARPLTLLHPPGIARALETKIYCDDKKLAILQAQDDPELHDLITRDPLEAQVHVCWLQDIKHDALADYLGKYSAGRMDGGFTKLIGLRPTGELLIRELRDAQADGAWFNGLDLPR